MKIIHHGQWERYSPDSSDELRSQFASVIFYRHTVSKKDFYEYRNNKFTEDTILVCSDDNGKIFEVSKGLRSVSPDNNSHLWELIPEEGDSNDYMDYIGKFISFKTKKLMKEKKTVPENVSAASAKIALYNTRESLYNLFEEILSTTNNIPLKIYFKDSVIWTRSSPYVIELAELLGLSESGMDNLFIKAQDIR